MMGACGSRRERGEEGEETGERGAVHSRTRAHTHTHTPLILETVEGGHFQSAEMLVAPGGSALTLNA